jgi:hypothetical protein
VNKTLLLMVSLCFLSFGCGQKSTIKNAVEPERLADAYGDGKHVIKSLTFPLTDSSLAYKTPLPGLGPIAGGLLKFVGDIFAKNTNMGKMQMSYTQPIPVIPTEVINSIRLKRFFFYMKPPKEGRRIRDWFTRVVLGHGHVTFDFLDKFAVRMASTHVEDPEHYVPILLNRDYDRREASSLMEVFNSNFKFNVIDNEKAKDIVLLKYDDSTKSRDTRSDSYGEIHILETTEDPRDIKYFLMDQVTLKGLYKRILILDKSILVEMIKDPVAEETFKKVLSDNAQLIEDLGVNFIDTCTPRSCLELAVPDVNLIPIANKGNALKLDAIIHAAKVPESFNLKGFVEFEIKLDSPI